MDTLVGDTPRKRRRAKVACRPCRDRKRKCDGHQPCGTCTQFEYQCYYSVSPRKHGRNTPDSSYVDRSTDDEDTTTATPAGPSTARPVAPPPSVTPDKAQHAHMQSLEANSGAAFVRRLGLKIDPNNAPRLRLFGWNTGERLAGCPPGTPRPITSILSYAGMKSLAQRYFEKVGIVYGFIDQPTFYERLSQRWARDAAPDDYDQVLCGVAALGFHLSQPSPPTMELDLVESAKVLLEKNMLLSPPPIDTVAGWILRVVYLRTTSTPHVTWLASCSLMHVVEAAGIHQEAPSQSVFDEAAQAVAVDARRRLWGMAQHLNIWASFDLGRTKITLPNVTTKPLTPKPGDHTSELLGLMPLTEVLDPNQPRSAEDLESDLSTLLDQTFEAPPVIMGQINLALCLYRRLRSQKSGVIHRHMDKILSLSRKGLHAARTMVVEYIPWHHAVNIPFQVVCLLLAVDSRASLPMVGEALSVLREVRDLWSSAAMHEAYDTAYLLVLLHQRRKDEDARQLRAALDLQTSTAAAAGAMVGGGGGKVGAAAAAAGAAAGSLQAMGTESVETLWLDDLFTNVPGLRQLDLEQFLVEETLNPQDLGTFGTHFGA